LARFIAGDVVIIPFPFSDLTQSKRRPALIVATLQGDDLIFCQITSEQTRADSYAIALKQQHFSEGGLKQNSLIRPNRLFTGEQSIISYKVGHLHKETFDNVINKIVEIIKTP
jgi:mRNA interferase MazF